LNANYLNRITEKIYVGAGYDMRLSDVIEVDPNGQLSTDGLVPGAKGGTTAGINLIVRHDDRDNNISAAKGSYIQAIMGIYNEFIGSDFNYGFLQIDFRKYWAILQERHVLAVQFLHSNRPGNPGFETMALLGGDVIMRGHYEGRFRDNGINAAQVEYRIPIGRKTWIDERKKIPFLKRFGLVGFAGTGHVYPSLGEMRWDQFVGSYGVGLRWLAIPEERINIRIDVGFGTENPGFYFQIREAF
jgi:outer membrane protein assembly factor BamA